MKKIILLAAILCSITLLQAQKVKGDISCLKGQKEINLTFNYDGDSEAKYLKEEDKAKAPHLPRWNSRTLHTAVSS